jgi:hypothetical protein
MTPTQLQALIDSVFAALEAADPSLAPLLAMLNGLVDSVGIPALAALLAALGINATTTVQAFIDGLFSALETKFAGHPFVQAMLSYVQVVVDAAISKLVVTPAMTKAGFTGK